MFPTATMATLLRLMVNILIATLLPKYHDPVFPLNDLAALAVQRTIKEPEVNSTYASAATEDMVAKCGYPLEIHRVISKDGYMTTLHRIPHSKYSANGKKSSKPPVVFVPGLFGDSFTYLFLAFILSNGGYDVWLVNNRGTRYSRRHVSLNPDTEKEFWNYSFHEMGVRDMPVIVNHVLSATKASELYLIGHSMGGAIISIFLAENPAYSRKVKAIFLLAPAVKVGHIQTVFARGPFLNLSMSIFNDMEVLPSSENLVLLADHYGHTSIFRLVVFWMLKHTLGFEPPAGMNQTALISALARVLAGTSTKTVYHFIQMISEDDFSSFDYGPDGNSQVYGQTHPPSYNLSLIVAPTWIFYTANDTLVPEQDVIEKSSDYGNLAGLIRVEMESEMSFSHMDFSASREVNRLVCKPIMAAMSTLEAKTEESHFSNDLLLAYVFLGALIMFTALTLFALYLTPSSKPRSDQSQLVTK